MYLLQPLDLFESLRLIVVLTDFPSSLSLSSVLSSTILCKFYSVSSWLLLCCIFRLTKCPLTLLRIVAFKKKKKKRLYSQPVSLCIVWVVMFIGRSSSAYIDPSAKVLFPVVSNLSVVIILPSLAFNLPISLSRFGFFFFFWYIKRHLILILIEDFLQIAS